MVGDWGGTRAGRGTVVPELRKLGMWEMFFGSAEIELKNTRMCVCVCVGGSMCARVPA